MAPLQHHLVGSGDCEGKVLEQVFPTHLQQHNMSLEAIQWRDRKLKILDQLLLPVKKEFVDVTCVEDGWSVINKMQVTLNAFV